MTAELPPAMRATLAPGTPMHDIVAVMSGIVAERAAVIDAAASLFDPSTTPEAFLPWLAEWYGFDWLFVDPADPRRALPMARAFPTGAARLRALLVAWPQLTHRRGSADGLRLTLELATGLQSIAVHHVPARQHVSAFLLNRSSDLQPWLARLIASERPAHMTWSLTVPTGAGA